MENSLSPEIMAKMATDLEALRSKDPDSFLSMMQMAGIPAPGNASPPAPGAAGPAPEITNEQLEAFAQMLQAMQQGGGEGPGLEMPDGKASLGPKGVESKAPGKYVTPEPGFVVKTRTEDANVMKVFINICTHDDLGEPGMKKRLDENGEEVEGLNIPMSVGPRRDDTDKAGVSCMVFDIMVNPTVVKEAVEDQVGKNKDFLCQLAIQSLEQKYSLSLDKRYKLPKLKAHGELQQQYIQDRKNMPKIEEVKSKKSTKAAAKPTVAHVVVKDDVKFVYDIGWETLDNCGEIAGDISWTYPRGEYVEPLVTPQGGVTAVLIVAEVEGVAGADVSVKISPFRCQIKVKGYTGASIYFPCAIVPPTATVHLARPDGAIKMAHLKISFPIDRSPWEDAADAGSKPWLVAQAMNDSGGDASAEGSAALYRSMANATIKEDSDTVGDAFHVRNRNYEAGGSKLSSALDSDDEELPEDMFHKKDAMSSYLLQQRKEEAKERLERQEQDKKERMDDPNVEYVDVEDYKPGGKYGDALPPEKVQLAQPPVHEVHLAQASSVLSSAVTEMQPGTDGTATASTLDPNLANPLGSLSSKMWSELL